MIRSFQLMNIRSADIRRVPGGLPGLVAIFCACLQWASSASAEDTWILIDTEDRTLSVMQGEKPLREFKNVSIGRNGATGRKVRQDRKTPLGSFRVSRINNDSVYHRFIGLDYPDLDYARRALSAGVISPSDYAAIRRAHEQGREPPGSTPLGGSIGIHGIGGGDPRFHEDYNWTEGCVALTNEEVDELTRWIRLGMVVLIL